MSNKVINLSEGLKDRKLLTLKEVCQIYGFKEWGLRHLVRRGRIPSVKIWGRRYFSPKKLDLWIEAHTIEAVE